MIPVKIDLYQQTTDRIVAALEAGTVPWVKPWKDTGAPNNALSGKSYNGINLFLLSMSFYTDQRWMTYKQAQSIGAQVRKGEHGTRIVFYKPFLVTDKNDTDSKGKFIPLLRAFTVFNLSQIDNLPEKYTKATEQTAPSDNAVNAAAEGAMSQATVIHGGGRACYIPSKDEIHLPNKAEFTSCDDYYATALHELTHWTGAKKRLDRDFTGRFGSNSYAVEELVAELGSAFLCARHSVNGKLQHAEYLANWLQVLKSDKRAIFTAASKARKAVEFIHPAPIEEESVAA